MTQNKPLAGICIFICLVVQLSACAQKFKLQEAYPGLKFNLPVEFVAAPDGSKRIFVIEQEGIIRVFENNPQAKEAKTFLDIRERVVHGGERGLLGLAFHPDFKDNGYFFVNYTTGKDLKTHISRFTASGKKETADPASEVVLLTYDQPYSNHNGGKIAFGKDGYLYISAGDGGSGGDPQNNGQNLGTLLGKIIRIDVNKKEGNLNYAIPQDNPFKGKENQRGEIYAFGLRNVWKFSFDRETGDLWAGDVGQNEREEIDLIKKGGNYGWKLMEGMACFKNDNCDKAHLELPVFEYLQKNETGRSVTGGFVYRGKKHKDLVGWYVYGDYVTGNIWRLKVDKNGKSQNQLLAKLNGALSSFGEDENGELYICSHGEGRIYSLNVD